MRRHRVLRRFIVEVLVFSFGAGLVWWWAQAADWMRPVTIGTAKVLHRIAGCPAPFLLAEVKPYFWFSPLFAPLAGLILASRWLSWGRRALQLLVGLACFWLIVALQMVLVYSPYLPLSAFRSYVERMEISAGYLGAQVILWVLLTGGPYRLLHPPETDGMSEARSHPLFGRDRYGVIAAIGFCVLFVVPIFVSAGLGGSGWQAARWKMSGGLRSGDDAAALVGLQMVLPKDPKNDPLIYLAARLHERRGEKKDAARLLRVVYRRRGMMEYYRREPVAVGIVVDRTVDE